METIKEYRKKRKLTISELARRSGISRNHLTQAESGTQFMSYRAILKVAKVLRISPARCFGLYYAAHRQSKHWRDDYAG